MSNIYYNPEKHGLEQVCRLSDDTISYAFDYIVVWREVRTGKLYWAHDIGCSCPTPFEDYRCIADLSYIDQHSLAELITQVYRSSDCGTLAEKGEFIRKVQDLLDDFGYWVRSVREQEGLED